VFFSSCRRGGGSPRPDDDKPINKKRGENVVALEIIRGQPYLTRKRLAEDTGRTIRTVDKKIEGIKREVKKGRYSPYALADNLVNYYVYIDYLTFEKFLADKNLRKTVPEFNPEMIQKMSGFNTKLIDIGE